MKEVDAAVGKYNTIICIDADERVVLVKFVLAGSLTLGGTSKYMRRGYALLEYHPTPHN